MKTSIAIIIIAIVALLVGGGIWWWQQNDEAGTQTDVVNNKNTVAINTNETNENQVSETNGWKTYTNESLDFEIGMPPGVEIELEMNDEHNRLVTFKGEDSNYEVRLREDNPENPTPLENYYYLDFVPTDKVTINGEDAMFYKTEHGYCDAGHCGPPFTAYAFKHNNDFYVISFYNDTEMSEEENQVIFSFKLIK